MPLFAQLVLQTAQAVFTACSGHDPRALARKENSGFAANAARSPDHENNLTL